MPHSTHEATKSPDSGRGKKADGSPAQAHVQQGTCSSQTTMLDRWATQTSRSELPFTEVVQQPDAGSSAQR